MTSATFFDAVKSGDAHAVSSMLDADGTLLASRTDAGLSAVMLAMYHHQAQTRDLLIARGAELDACEAAAAGRLERLTELTRATPAQANARSADGGTPLHFAAYFGHPAVVEHLLSCGADVNAVGMGRIRVRPLHSALAHRGAEARHRIVRTLLAHGAEVNVAQEGGWTPLHQAAHNGDAELVDELLARGADRAARASDGRTAAEMAAERGDAAIAARLTT